MKKVLFIAFFFLVSCAGNKKTRENIDVNDKHQSIVVNKKYKIVKIDSTKNLYIFYAKNNDSIFKLLSEKLENNKCEFIIRKNEYYNLKIQTIFSPNLIQKSEMSHYKFKSSIIKLGTDDSVWDLFVSENINGLCYKK